MAQVDQYITFAEGDTFFASRLDANVWTNATESDKNKALKMATKRIDRLNYQGFRIDKDSTNQFPRGTDASVPQDIKDASALIAIELLDGWDDQLENENLFMVEQKYDKISSKYDRSNTPEYILAGIPTLEAWRYIRPFIRDPRTIDFSRTS